MRVQIQVVYLKIYLNLLYYDALKLIKNKSFKVLIENLNKAEENQKKDADIYNYLGFSYRKMGNMKLAAVNYEKALDIDPKHKGALEYQGEMYITLGQLDKAKVNLKKLEKICFLIFRIVRKCHGRIFPKKRRL